MSRASTSASEQGLTGPRQGLDGGPERGDVAQLRSDDAAWDHFVTAAEDGSYLQTTPWAAVKRSNGWQALRVVAPSALGAIGAQLLVRRVRGIPWAIGYAPRGPVSGGGDRGAWAGFTKELRQRCRAGRVSYARIDPAIGIDEPVAAWLAAEGWRPAAAVQPDTTRLIDLTRSDEALWSDLRPKWRQYVMKARRARVRVVEGDGGRLDDFYRIYAATARRAGFLFRAERTHREIWEAFAPRGMARLLFAESADGEPLAALYLVSCGDRMVEPYGGMTEAGADLRANYLLKWEAIIRSRGSGYRTYDLWGLPTPGIAHFKSGFGGREVRYIGAWDLVVDPLGRTVLETAQGLRTTLARWRYGLRGASPPAGGAGSEEL